MHLVATVVTGNSAKTAAEPPTILGGKASCRRKFVVNVELKDEAGKVMSRDLTLAASLAFAHDESPVVRDEKPSLAEPPLFTTFNGVEYPAHERPTQMVSGRASFKLAISVLSSKCDNRLFCIAITPLQPEGASEEQELPAVCYSGPIRSISRKRTRSSQSQAGKAPGSPSTSMGTTNNTVGRSHTPRCPLPASLPFLHTHLPRLASPTSSAGDTNNSIGTMAEDGEEVNRHMSYRRRSQLASISPSTSLPLPTSSPPLHRLASNMAVYHQLLLTPDSSNTAMPLPTTLPPSTRANASVPSSSQAPPPSLLGEPSHQLPEEQWMEARGMENPSTTCKDSPATVAGKQEAAASPLQSEHSDTNIFSHTPTSTAPPSPAFGPFRPYASIASCRMPAKEAVANNAALPAKKRRLSPSEEDQPSPNGPFNVHSMSGSGMLPMPLQLQQLQGLLPDMRSQPYTRPTNILQRFHPLLSSLSPENSTLAVTEYSLHKEEEEIRGLERTMQTFEKELHVRRASLKLHQKIFEEQESSRQQLEEFLCHQALQRHSLDQGY